MGATPSTDNDITNDNDQTFITENYVKSVSENINKQISNTIIKDAKSCTANINNNQAITIKGMSTKGNFNFTGNQKQVAALTFSCVQSSIVRNNVGSEIIATLTNGIGSKVNNTALSELTAKAEQAAETGFASTGGVNQEQKITNTNKFKSETKNIQDIENLVQNIVENNFSSDTISNCISQVNNNQSISLEEITVGGDAIIAIDQDQAATVVSSCIQENNVGSGIMNAATAAFDVKVINSTSAESSQSASATATQTSKQQGFFDGVAGVIGAVGSIFGSLLGFMALPYILAGIVFLVFVLCLGSYCLKSSPEDNRAMAGMLTSAMGGPSQFRQQIPYAQPAPYGAPQWGQSPIAYPFGPPPQYPCRPY